MSESPISPEGYLPRIIDAQVDRYLETFGAVEISGTKWCGKTWTALHHGKSVSYIDDDYELAKADPNLVTLGERPHVIDEWQLVPRIWDVVRRSVDETRGIRGGWILTGSSTPIRKRKGNDDKPHHSGAGRIGRIHMRPMSLAETGDSNGSVSLSALFRGEFSPCMAGDNDTMRLVELVCRGGWPEVVGRNVAQSQLVAREYLRLFFTESIPAMGGSSDTAMRLVASLARNLCQAATRKTIASDMYGEHETKEGRLAASDTITSYLSMLRQTYLIEEIPGWVPQARSRKRLAVKPKRYFADPSLAAAQLGMAPDALLKDWQTFGLMFENLCMRDLLVYAEALPEIEFEPVRYYRDDAGLEVDAIVELADSRWAAFEFKTSEDKVDEAVASLKRLRAKLTESAGARVRPPEFMAVVVGIARYAREVEPGIYVIPIRTLTA